MALYIRDTQNDGEKVLHKWTAGCLSENYSHAMIEIEETQALNKRAKSSKTYHLIVSFRPEDEDKLNEAVFKDIEASFAEALGFTEHQRICGVHKNTENIHMHIAYNKVHPEKHTCYSPGHDYLERDSVCRKLEQKYDFCIDEGIKPNQENRPANRKAKTMEAHTGLESFDSYVRRHKEQLMEALAQSGKWLDLDQALAIYGLCIKPYGNGLVIKDQYGKSQIKASALDRNFSKNKLETKFGTFIPAASGQEKFFEVQYKYGLRPVHSEIAGQNTLFLEFAAKIEIRENRLASIGADTGAEIKAVRGKYQAYRQNIILQPMRGKDRNRLIKSSRLEEKQEAADIRTKAFASKEAVRVEFPFASWLGFLQYEARLGNETALKIMRAKNKKVLPELDKTYVQIKEMETKVKAGFNAKQADLVSADLISPKDRKAASTLLQIEEFRTLHPEALPNDCRISIGKKGTVIIQLPTGGYIRDTGQELQYSPFDNEARNVALLLVKHKWSKSIMNTKPQMDNGI